MSISGITSFRDLILIPLGADDLLVIACDSLGAIGPKLYDSVKAPAEVVGKYTLRVPLMEVLACGAAPIVVVNTLSVEMEPTGSGILKGIKEEIALAGLPAELAVTGSTEENVATYQTGLGVTVIGRAEKGELRLGRSRAGDLVLCIGEPKVGAAVLDSTKKADPSLVRDLLAASFVREILPAGSRGVLHEAELLAECSRNRLVLTPFPEIDLQKSAGPATCVLVSVAEAHAAALRDLTDLPLSIVGTLK